MIVRYGKEYVYKIPKIIKDEEANKIKTWDEGGIVKAYIYPAGGRVQAEVYGKEVNYIQNLLTNETVLEEGYGILVETTKTPDFEVISIKKYTNHIEAEIRKING